MAETTSPLAVPRDARDSRAMYSMVLSCLVCLALASPLRAEDVLVFAAASLAGPLDAASEHFEQETGHTITISYGASSTLARQVAAGAPADVVILANEAWMDHLSDADILIPGTRHDFLTNSLVLIGGPGADNPLAVADLPDVLEQDRIAVALTEAVPAGIYARSALESLGIWSQVQPNVVEADNVRAALMLVALGAARYGIVYATDVVQEPRVLILSEISEDLHPPIRYPIALVSGADPVAEQFSATLRSLAARHIFGDAGFGIAP